MAEALISKGYGKALRHRQDDDLRSSCYDELLSAEARAEKNRKGLFSKKDYTPIKVADFSGVSRARRGWSEWLKGSSCCCYQREDSACASVCLSIFLCEYMNLVGGGDCAQCVNTFVWQVAGLCSELRQPQHTAMPPPPLGSCQSEALPTLPPESGQDCGSSGGGEGGEGWVGVAHDSSLLLTSQYVASGSRFRLYLSKDTCLVNFLLAGVSCPRAGQAARSGETVPGEPWGDEGLTFSKELILQREVGGAVEGPHGDCQWLTALPVGRELKYLLITYWGFPRN